MSQTQTTQPENNPEKPPVRELALDELEQINGGAIVPDPNNHNYYDAESGI